MRTKKERFDGKTEVKVYCCLCDFTALVGQYGKEHSRISSAIICPKCKNFISRD